MHIYKVEEYECSNALSTEDDFSCVAKFLDFFMTEEIFGTLVIANSRFLMNKRVYGITHEPFIEIPSLSKAKANCEKISRSCIGGGHLSVIFAIKDALCLEDFLETELFTHNGSVDICSGGADDPSSEDQHENLNEALHYLLFNNSYEVVCSFSHDAEFFYKIKKGKR